MTAFELGYLGLFITCFLAATILPIASEVFLIGMLAANYDPTTSLIIASIGNTSGAWLNYGIGFLGNPKWLLRIRITQEKIDSWQDKVTKYGVYLALFSWLPFVGDVIGVVLGFFRVNWKLCFLFIFIGKFLRYLVFVVAYPLFVK